MNTSRRIIRSIILLSIGIIALFGIFCEPDDVSDNWLTDVAVSKATGAVALLLFVRLHRRWHPSGEAGLPEETGKHSSL